jgi:hypothetical protein
MRTCMFCPDKASSREHVWPKWLLERFQGSGVARTYFERGEKMIGEWANPEIKVKCVCIVCNNGWMSGIEGRTKPIIEAILDDRLNQLDVTEQSMLAIWAVKTTMVSEALGPKHRGWIFSETEREQMRTAHAVPPRTSVWIAKCVGHAGIYSAVKDHWTSSNHSGARAIAVTMAFGSLVFHVVHIKAPSVIPEDVAVTYDVAEGRWDETLVQVWPPNISSLVWPSKYGLTGELGLNALTERLRPSS